MLNTLLIFIGSGMGGICRYWISSTIYTVLGRPFPYGTLFVNASGCFLMGLLFILILEKWNGVGHSLRLFLLVGFMGGYTTFSTFSIETLALYQNGAGLSAVLNIFLNVTLCILLTSLGILLGKQL